MTESTVVSSPSRKADGTAASSSIQIPDELLKQYACGPVRFSGSDNALYDRHLFFDNVVDASAPDARMRYEAAAHSVRDVLSQRWVRTEDTYQRENAKRVYYISMEFLIGRSLSNNVQNLLLDPVLRDIIQSKALDWSSLLEQEPDAGLGNGGLGRLAACFLDSMATLQFPAMGYGLRYEYGIFKQFIREGWQEERPDNWLRRVDPWEVARPNEAVEVKLNCSVELREGHLQVVPGEPSSLIAIPYDRPVVGYGGGNINTLRLWAAAAPDYFDFHRFSRGEFIAALTDSLAAETITRVLYPDDSTLRGEALRFLQEYFLVAASLADLVRRFRAANDEWANFHGKVAIQLNDTHPSLAVPELMRLLLDDAHLGWDQAWDITQKTLAYTNHTLLPEALEKWPLQWFQLLIPRNLEIIYEINRRFLDSVRQRFPGDEARVARMSLIDENEPRRIRMAHLAIVGSHSTNGVAAIHSRLLRTMTVKDFSDMFPERFNNKTNGVTPRRWLLSSNPALAAVITDAIGDRWITDLSELRKLTPLADDSEFRKLIRAAKHDAKASFATWLNATSGVVVNPDSIFDSLVKRIHEYKRQLLDALRIIVLYNRLRENPGLPMPPRTFFFAGKAAPAYVLAKLIIKLINNVSAVIDNDPAVRGRLKVLFLPDYRVSLAERLIPATEVSNQISTAGYEASGTGNMKFMMNGALTIGTRDGATIEMAEEAGEENFFLFGLTAEQVASNRAWYKPQWHYDNEPETRAALDLIFSDHFSPSEPGIFAPLRKTLLGADFYMHLADLTSYLEADQRLLNVYADPDAWTRMSILNIAGSGKFSSDRTIADYATDIWNAKPCPVP
jgi:glycogen phosphorylase